MADVAERVTAASLPAYAGRVVCMAGKIVSQQHGVITLEGTGGKQAIVNGTPHVADSDFIEVIGRAEADGSISYHDHGALGNAFDLENYEGMVAFVTSQGAFYRKFVVGASERM